MPIDYSQYLNANQRGLDTLNQTRLATLNQPNKVQSFMEGLRGGQDRVAQQRALTDKQKLDEILRRRQEEKDARDREAADYEISQRPTKQRLTNASAAYQEGLAAKMAAPAPVVVDPLEDLKKRKYEAEIRKFEHDANAPYRVAGGSRSVGSRDDDATIPGTAAWKRLKDVEFRAANAKGNIKDIDTVNAMLNNAEDLIKAAPGSYLGAGKSAALSGLGFSTDASKATASLKSLQASLMMKMPRMEGPQGVLDVQLYKEQAGQISDPTVPMGDKLAALGIMRNIMNKYKDQNTRGLVSDGVGVDSAPSGKTLSKTVFDRLTPAAQKMHLASGGVVK